MSKVSCLIFAAMASLLLNGCGIDCFGEIFSIPCGSQPCGQLKQDHQYRATFLEKWDESSTVARPRGGDHGSELGCNLPMPPGTSFEVLAMRPFDWERGQCFHWVLDVLDFPSADSIELEPDSEGADYSQASAGLPVGAWTRRIRIGECEARWQVTLDTFYDADPYEPPDPEQQPSFLISRELSEPTEGCDFEGEDRCWDAWIGTLEEIER
jgi:hypothetical protein